MNLGIVDRKDCHTNRYTLGDRSLCLSVVLLAAVVVVQAVQVQAEVVLIFVD